MTIPVGWLSIDYKSAIEKISTNKIKIKQSEYLNQGNFPIIDQGQNYIGGYTNNKEKIIYCDFPVIVFGDHTKVVKLINFSFAPGADGVKVVKPLSFFNPKIFFYFTKYLVKKIPDKGYSRHFQYIEKEKIPLPPLNEQNRIVEKIEELFSDLDKATEDLKKTQEQLKIYRQAVLKAAFEGKLTEEWRKKNMLLMLPDNLKKKIGVGVSELNYSYIKNIPQKWILSKINRICSVVRGGSPRPMGDPKYFDGNIPFIKIGDITKLSSKYVLNSKTKVNEQGTKKSRLLPKGSLILSNSGTICIPKFLGVDACIHDGFVSFKDLPEYINVNFLFEFFEYIRPYVIQKNKQGVTQVNLNIEIVGDIDLLIPTKEEQEQIVQEIESRLSVCDKLEETVHQSLEKIEYLRQSILKKAFEGKLVSQDPNDLPACELLKQIKIEKDKMSKNEK